MSCLLRENPSLADLAATLEMAATPTSRSLIPVLGLDPRDVTGIQPPRVGAVNDSCNVKEFPAPKDLGALDSCDEHRNEGARIGPPQAWWPT
ncbi:hypothetical protein ATY29_20280 [Rhizobium hidalgonense]|nr:hypothetical protein ATY29_20280 [Rhizobium hidalgonense]